MKNDIPIIWNRFVAFDEEDRRFLKAVRDEVQGVLKSKSASFFRRHV